MESHYTIWTMEHHLAKTLLEILAESPSRMRGHITDYTDGEKYCVVMEYRQERSLKKFYTGTYFELHTCETICINLMIECMTCAVPYPILYLILKQRRINLKKDNHVYFDFELDLSELDQGKKEKDCVHQCAKIILELLSVKETEKAISYHLVRKKVGTKNYERFTDLYKDVQLAAVPQRKQTGKEKAREIWQKYQARLYHLLMITCAVLFVITVILIILQLIWGGMPILRLFQNTFEKIGTESLLQ